MASRALLAAWALALAGCQMTFIDEEGLRSSQLPPHALIVDGSSLGGRCDDAYSAEQALSPRTPWCSITRALEAAPRGWSVSIRGGAYPLLMARTPSARSAELLLQPYPLERVEIAGVVLKSQQYLRFQGLHFTGPISIQAGVSHVTFSDCDITSETPAAGVHVEAPVEDFSLVRCIVHDLREAGDGVSGRGFLADEAGARIRLLENRFLRLEGVGVRIANAQDLTVEGNQLPDSAQPFFITDSRDVTLRANRVHGSGGPVWLHGIEGLRLENNVFTGFVHWAVDLANVPGARILNNTLWGNGQGGIDLNDVSGPATVGVVLQNNILQTLDGLSAKAAAFAFEDYNLVGGGHFSGVHDVARPPMFMDAASLDFHLAPGSPGIDAALADGAPQVDADGRPRWDEPEVPDTGAGAPPHGDLGAFEGR
ncbi:right-handed parallel beta-helix repeat-containing protein [Pyxidicoccus fallax]|uniref:Right-handed parallel beta-helix repeat-containing protein n=1 Tax=Pyxidicoccus fallax TaxID=394095 RepID=A0A848LM81_9BACT|nr:right-handed parallel beta-helix repeat-containing protein [Pyxidicoccus fallax]NMO18821.1 right-handed parallel beta-helix repeat-containing protein [Pyxidicoccus fallax]NPC78026.1 right-handed parallel beta-helix repeat-containing protein [Pyxidicoccus fallax]